MVKTNRILTKGGVFLKKSLSIILSLMMLFSVVFSTTVLAETTYSVQSGDVLWKIADEYGLEWEELAEFNALENPHLIFPGQLIRIPSEDTMEEVTPETPETPEIPETPEEVPQEPVVESTKLTVLHTNDMHGFFVEGAYDGMGAAKLAAYYNSVKADNPNTLILDAGDATQGHNLVTLSKGEKAMPILNALGYDAMVTGNHEFDYGQEQLQKNVALAEFPILAANIVDEDGEDFLSPYIIKEMNGLSIAIFGLATPETKYKSHPDNTVGLTFNDPIETAKMLVPTLREQADVVIGLVHLGDEGTMTSGALAEAVEGIDLIIDGHSHSTYEKGMLVNDTLIVSAGEKTKNVGHVDITLVEDKVTSVQATLFTKEQSLELIDDVVVADLVKAVQEENAVIENEVVATAPYELNGEREFVRTGETNLGNMITEALLDISGADVALTNGGGIRASIEAGEVTKGDVLTVLPFGNTVRIIDVTGADIIAALENGLSTYPEALGAFPHVAGMMVQFDSSKEAGSRVVSVMIGDEMLDEEAVYSLATNDFIVAGGDGYTMFIGANVTAEFGAMDEVLIDFIAENGFDASEVTGRIQDVAQEDVEMDDAA